MKANYALTLFSSFFIGIASTIPSIVGEIFLIAQLPIGIDVLFLVSSPKGIVSLVLSAWVVGVIAPLIEETFKSFGYLIPSLKFREIFSLKLALVAGLLAGFGFGIMENLFYSNMIMTYTPEKYDAIMIFRWWVCVPVHMISTSMGCLYLTQRMRKFEDWSKINFSTLFIGLAPAYILHGLYDFLIILINPLG